MGIYDRDYYRREGPSFLGSLTERGTACKWLIAVNVFCFLLQFISTTKGSSPFTDALLLDVNKVLDGQVWRLLTYAFLHDTHSIWHIVINMMILFYFGRDLEDAIGQREFITVYLVSAVLGGVVFLATQTLIVGSGGRCLGASGAVMTVLVMTACREPHRKLLLFFVLPIPIWLVAVYLVAEDLFQFLGRVDNGIAVQVHLAGAAFGFLHFTYGWRLSGWLPGKSNPWRRISRPNLRLYREEMTEDSDDRMTASVGATTAAPPMTSATTSSLDDEQLEAKMDAVLEKWARDGKESLTESEWHVLQKASERLRRRRS